MEKANSVYINEGDDKLELLEKTVTEAGLYDYLEESLKKSGKQKKNFSIVIKPNFMVLTAKADLSNYTDTEMVEYLMRRFYDLGYRKLYVTESENVLSQWYRNRSVTAVAKAAGYKEDIYKIDNITRDAVTHDYNGILKHHFVGRVWKAADFRISFAKNKSHPAGVYTLTLKNLFGVTVYQNKYLDYHKHLEWDKCVIDMIDAFPVHFGIVDAFISSDGPFGFRGTKRPKQTKTIIAGRDLKAVDWVGALKMGIDPMRSRLMKKVVNKWGKPTYSVSGPITKYEKWKAPPFFLPYFDDILEEWYGGHSFFTHTIMLPPDPEFPEPNAWLYKFIRFILFLHYPK